VRVFLCHSSEDKPQVRELYRRLISDGYDAWLDEENVLPGQDWEFEIRRAVRRANAVVVCLSRTSVSKTGYVQKEIGFALDVAAEQPEGQIFIIPVRLEDCDVPDRLSRWHWVDLFNENGYQLLVRGLRGSSSPSSPAIEPRRTKKESLGQQRNEPAPEPKASARQQLWTLSQWVGTVVLLVLAVKWFLRDQDYEPGIATLGGVGALAKLTYEAFAAPRGRAAQIAAAGLWTRTRRVAGKFLVPALLIVVAALMWRTTEVRPKEKGERPSETGKAIATRPEQDAVFSHPDSGRLRWDASNKAAAPATVSAWVGSYSGSCSVSNMDKRTSPREHRVCKLIIRGASDSASTVPVVDIRIDWDTESDQFYAVPVEKDSSLYAVTAPPKRVYHGWKTQLFLYRKGGSAITGSLRKLEVHPDGESWERNVDFAVKKQ
jgi:hypothetical protein